MACVHQPSKVRNDINGVAVGWEVEPSSKYGVDKTIVEYGVEVPAEGGSTAGGTDAVTSSKDTSKYGFSMHILMNKRTYKMLQLHEMRDG